MANHLRALGLSPVLIPAIEIVGPSSFAVLDAAVRDLGSFDWVVFTSANAVKVFAEKVGTSEVPSGIRLAAIGPSTARALEAAGFRADLVPPTAVAESLATALLRFTLRGDKTPASFLIVRAEEGREHLPAALRDAGAAVTIAPAYRTVVPAESIELLRELFTPGDNDLGAITFTSSSTARNLLALCEAADLSLPRTALRVSIGPITSATMREIGWPPDAEAPMATVESLAETVGQALKTGIRS